MPDIQAEKTQKSIFVIMPFREANGRKPEDLSYFFSEHIKKPIENNKSFLFEYKVTRSDTELSITDGIIEALVNSDFVICDVSGPRSNANVMYELGIRFSVSHKPVILIREAAEANQTIFDIHGLYQQEYSQNRIANLETHLAEKIKKYENGLERYCSPILKSINATSTYWSEVPRNKACAFLGGLSLASDAALKIFGSQVQTYILEKDNSYEAYPPNEVYKILQSIGDSKILNDFNYSFARLPALDNYLSSIYLMGLVDELIERKFRELLIGYSINFLTATSPYIQGDRTLLYTAYAAESLLLINICRCLIKILQAQPGSIAESNAISAFHHNAQKSNIIKD